MSEDRRISPVAYVFFFGAFASILLLSHIPLLNLPYHWDELGQFVPASLDLYHTGSLIPRTAAPNVHPPGVPLYLAAVWRIFGVSIPVTRIAMLMLASFGALFAFLLAIRLGRESRGAPGFLAVGLLLVSPWFYTQSMLAQLDMPAMVFTAMALLLFLQDRLRAAAAACVALVLAKETGALVPAVFAAWLFFEKRRREALYFLAPFAVLAAWLAYLAHATGHLFGDAEFARYNVLYSMHPARAWFAFLRRVYMLGVGSFHWIGLLAIVYAARHTRLFATRDWKVTGLVVAAHVVAFTFLGGAVLERYLVPLLPPLYAAMAVAFLALPGRWRIAAPAVCGAGLLACNFVAPVYAYPLENNLAFADFVELQKTAAGYLERNHPRTRVATVWPLSTALHRPELGYVHHRLPVRQLQRIDASTLIDPDEILVTFSFDRIVPWKPPLVRFAGDLARRFYGHQPPLPPFGLAGRLHLIARWSRRGHWIEVYGTPGALE
jgi:4-amino-4-deoxy-L-arabinose transferase-like glycosyltransferase